MTAVPVSEENSDSFGITKRMVSFGKGPIPDFVDNTQVEIHWQSRIHASSESSAAENILDDTRKIFGKDKPMSLVFGRNFRLPCIETCVKTMCVGEVAQFTVSDPTLTAPYPAFAASLRSLLNPKSQPIRSHCCGALAQTVGYGHPDLDALMQKSGQALDFIIELCAVHNPGEYQPEKWQLTDDQRLEKLEDLRQEGNRSAVAKDWKTAASHYSEALESLDLLCSREKPGEPEWIENDARKIVFYSNLAQCQLQLDDYLGAVDSCNEVIRRDPTNVKAFFRRARAYAKLWEEEKAFNDWAEVIKLDRSLQNAVLKESTDFRQLLDKYHKEEAERMKAAFSK